MRSGGGAQAEEMSAWLSGTVGLSGKRLAAALVVCDQQMLEGETTDDPKPPLPKKIPLQDDSFVVSLRPLSMSMCCWSFITETKRNA